MAGYIKIEVEKPETQQINLNINAEIFEEFQKKCKIRNLQMCTVVETFARQYANNNYDLDRESILKWKDDNNSEKSTLNTPINKDVYGRFKTKVKAEGLFVKHVVSAFVEDYAKKEYILEFVQIGE